MNTMEECLYQCRKLIQLIEQEETEIVQCMQGVILNGYQETLKCEKDHLQDMVRLIKNNI